MKPIGLSNTPHTQKIEFVVQYEVADPKTIYIETTKTDPAGRISILVHT